LKGLAGLFQKALISKHIAVVAPEASVAAVKHEGLFRAVPSLFDFSLLSKKRPKVPPCAVETGILLNRPLIKL